MSRFCAFYKSTIGKKAVVAVTGAILFLFVIGHMIGNLKTFLGKGSDGMYFLDHYAEFLRTFLEGAFGHGGFLWLTRLGLLGALVLHVVTIIQLRALNMRARPIGYANSSYRATTFSAKTMMAGGVVILIFVIFHLLHMTTGHLHVSFVHGKVYQNVYRAFQDPAVTGIYFIAMIALGFHLFHGSWSLFQTLGLDNPDRNPTLRLGAKLGSVVIVVGFLSVPIAVLFGLLPAP